MVGIYEKFCKTKDYNQATKDCIENTVREIKKTDTTAQKPGMLLGKIQSGKTRTFIGVTALAFDKGYDFAVVLTKATNALTKQTYERLCQEFEEFVEDDEIGIYDIMNTPDELTPYIRGKKLIFIVKKETHNLDRLVKLFEKYEDFRTKQVLIIDDEADYASIGFKRDGKQIDDVSINTIANKINRLRDYGATTSFLQVTATPYSLYLQPDDIHLNGEEYHPVRPAFTELVPIYKGYIGGEFYFEESENPDSPAYYLHVDVPEKELEVLGKRDMRYLSNILDTPNLEVFRFAILNFLVGGSIRWLQEQPRKYKCSCIIHIEVAQKKHTWQYKLVETLLEELKAGIEKEPDALERLVRDSYNNLKLSIKDDQLPTFKDVFTFVKKAIGDGYVGISKINSEGQVQTLLDRKGQLRLDNPFNIFIGGQILDRGITIENLICFFYGRNPKKFQQDTVLQHSRMYGARSKQDISVTRFYTSSRIYDAMKKMHQFDTALREAFEKGQHKDGVVFLEKDTSGSVKICAPNKILISSTETIRPYRRLLPRGMQTVSATKMTSIASQIEQLLEKYKFYDDSAILIDCDDAVKMLDLIYESYEFSHRFKNLYCKWDIDSYKAIIHRLCVSHCNSDKERKIYCFIRRNRNISRFKEGYAFTDAPDDGRTDIPLAKKHAQDLPVLQLFHQNGKKKNGWRDVPFWWPVLICPKKTKTLVFTAETL